jgi:hypothetical protein
MNADERRSVFIRVCLRLEIVVRKTKPMRHLPVPPVSGIADRGGLIGGDSGKALMGWRRFLENGCHLKEPVRLWHNSREVLSCEQPL